VTDRSDLIQNEVNGATTFDEHGIWFTTASVSEDAASYSELESVATPYADLVYPSRELPPVPVIYDRVVTDNGGMNGIISNEPRSISGISSAVAATSYSRLTSSTREPPPVPSVYDRPTTRDYCNIVNANNGATDSTVCDDPHNDSGVSSTICPSTADASSYSGLVSSTRERPPAPSVYDELANPDYCNINSTDNGAASDTVCEDQQTDFGISSSSSPSTADTTSYSGLTSSTREQP